MDYGKNIKILLIEHNKTTKDLAKYLNINVKTLYRKLNGEVRFYLQESIKIALFFETDLNTLFFNHKNKGA